MNASMSCPSASKTPDRILLGHGGGGRLMQTLLREKIQRVYGSQTPSWHDATVLNLDASRVAMTTDSYVVHPLFFPGGDIGKLAVYGTVNDLAMAGAIPRYLSLALIMEEGLPLETLDRILNSIVDATAHAGVAIVTGDSKVVERGKGDGLFINTSGLGVLLQDSRIHPSRIQSDDAIILSGDIGRHGVAVMNARSGPHALELDVTSDCAPLHQQVAALLAAPLDLHCLRDLTRGGLAAALHELARDSGHGVIVDDERVPILPAVAAYCEILGLEPHAMANEGRFIAVLPARQATDAVRILQGFPGSHEAAVIGAFDAHPNAAVRTRTVWGTERLLPLFSGEQLPRIC